MLGAYPSAVHVIWSPPRPEWGRVQALPVDNEPEPFWDGKDEAGVVEAWKRKVSFDEKRWGQVEPAGRFNGSSGEWLTKNVLEPLQVRRSGAWITDALDMSPPARLGPLSTGITGPPVPRLMRA